MSNAKNHAETALDDAVCGKVNPAAAQAAITAGLDHARSNAWTSLNVLEIAWAAGFFDGEGHVSASKQAGKRSCNMRIQIAQTDPEVLFRFQAAVGGLGRVIGPNNYGWRDVWMFRVNRFEHAQAIVAILWRFLSSAKRADASRALLRMRDWRAEHAAMCRRGLHRLADVGLTTAGSCAECDRMNRRAKYREANPLREKTHCKSGEHELTPENTYLWRGVKCCKACRRDNKKGQSGHRIKRQRVISVLHENPGQSNRQIARLLGVSHNLVGTVRKQMVAEKVLGMP